MPDPPTALSETLTNLPFNLPISTAYVNPTFFSTLLTLSILYLLTFSPLPTTPSLNLDYLLHLTRILFPPLGHIYSLCIGYTLSILVINSAIPVAPVVVALWYTLLYSASALNIRLGLGKAKKFVWSDQIAVVTGGAGGLGWLVAKLLELKGAEVVVWDIKAPEEWNEDDEDEAIKWYKVDVGNAEEVDSAYRKVQNDIGTPTILINNAGIVNGKPLLSLSAAQISRCFSINTLSHFHTCRSFLPGMLASPSGGTIVTVSSVLGHLGASHLTDYTASKAALLALHTSLRAEIKQMANSKTEYPGAENTKTILVKPGQLSTAMFSTLKSPSDFFGPVVQAKDLAREIVEMIEDGRDGVLCMPVYAWLIEWLGVLPVSLQRAARWMSGVDGAMKTFASKQE
ncbi:NAD(P)-binding protein, partial [Aureobasidium melanogenum]